jgi:hypothetical protein
VPVSVAATMLGISRHTADRRRGVVCESSPEGPGEDDRGGRGDGRAG